MLTPFHLAITVHDLESARAFYGGVLGCEEGRSASHWVDFNLFGHQLVCHLVETRRPELAHNPVDGDEVPVPHFGVVLTMEQWRELRDRLLARRVTFIIEPHVRFKGEPGEQATMFFLDPSHNALEFKAFENIETELFRRDQD